MATHSRRPERVAQLTGRSSELSVLDRLIDVVRGGQSRVLVVSGEPGVGLVFAARVPDEDLARAARTGGRRATGRRRASAAGLGAGRPAGRAGAGSVRGRDAKVTRWPSWNCPGG